MVHRRWPAKLRRIFQPFEKCIHLQVHHSSNESQSVWCCLDIYLDQEQSSFLQPYLMMPLIHHTPNIYGSKFHMKLQPCIEKYLTLWWNSRQSTNVTLINCSTSINTYNRTSGFFWPPSNCLDCGRREDFNMIQQTTFAEKTAIFCRGCQDPCHNHRQKFHTERHVYRQIQPLPLNNHPKKQKNSNLR